MKRRFLAIFLLHFCISSRVAWSVSCPEGRIEEGKLTDPFVLPCSLSSILPPGKDFALAPPKLIGLVSLKNNKKAIAIYSL
jgi:hypothetical protein